MIRNPITWPNGARCAVAFTWDVDVDAAVHAARPDDADNHVATLSLMRYEPAVAVPRILDLFDRHAIPLSCFVPGWVIENHPAMVESIVAAGHEIGHHGYLHHDNNAGSREDERDVLLGSIRLIEQVSGRKPRGYRTPNLRSNGVSRHTLPLLAAEGFLYDSSLFGDDIPYLVETESGRLVEIPCLHGLDDWKHYMNWRDFGYAMPVQAPSRVMQFFTEEFEAAWTHGGFWMSVWHPAVSGRLARCAAIEPLIAHMKAKGDVWFARLEEVAAHVQAEIDRGAWQPRVDRVPYRVGPIPAARTGRTPA